MSRRAFSSSRASTASKIFWWSSSISAMTSLVGRRRTIVDCSTVKIGAAATTSSWFLVASSR